MKTLVDHMNLVFIAFSMANKNIKEMTGEELTEESIGFFYHTLLNDYNKLFKTFGPVIVCHEGKGSLDWRRSIYPDYKRNRDKSKNEPAYLLLKKQFKIIEDLLEYFPVKQIRIDGAEGDDVMYALSKYIVEEENEDVLLITSDGDMIQVKETISDRIDVFSPIKNKIMPAKPDIIRRKAITGDSSDNIPGLYRVGPKTFDKMVEDENLWNEKMRGDNKEIYESFLKIVDLSEFPKKIHEEIINEYKRLDWNKFNPGEVEVFYFENNMMDHIHRWNNDVSDITEKMVDCGFEIDHLFKTETLTKTDNSVKTEVDEMLSEFI